MTIDDVEYTEVQLNANDDFKISEAQLPDYFASPSYNMLIVADKYQTGFDEPKLHSMFVDKGLKGVKAVQTLSRLNRTCGGKHDTYVLDFANCVDDIQTAFQSFYEDTRLEEALDVNVVYGYYDQMVSFMLWNDDDISKFVKIYSKKGAQTKEDLGKITSVLSPVVERYNILNEEQRDTFRDALKNFIRFYAYITQIARMFDKELHHSYLFCEYLFRFMPKSSRINIDLDEQILLSQSRLNETFSGSVQLEINSLDRILKPENPNKTKKSMDKKDLLDNIIDKINLMYQGDFDSSDKSIIEAIFDKIYNNPKVIAKHAKKSDPDMFEKSIFPDEFDKAAQECFNEKVDGFNKLFSNTAYYKHVASEMAKFMYMSLRSKK